jgi:hypothetical protein
MSRQRRRYGAPIAIVAMLVLSLRPAGALAQAIQGEFDPCPFTPATRANVAGSGSFTASLDGTTLSITGKFSDLSSPATAAHLRMGLAMGVPGTVVGELSVSHEVSGAVTGKLTLSAEQLVALRRNSIYIQIDSIKAPDCTVWGWLESHH